MTLAQTRAQASRWSLIIPYLISAIPGASNPRGECGEQSCSDYRRQQRHWRGNRIGIEVNHSTYDTLYLAFAVAMGASAVVAADGPFLRSMQTHPDPTLSAMLLSLDAWAAPRGIRHEQRTKIVARLSSAGRLSRVATGRKVDVFVCREVDVA